VKIRDLIRRLEDHGWELARTKGSHRQCRAEEGGPNMKYIVVVEEGPDGFGAHVPDLPGCVVAGPTREEVMQLIKEAIEFHLEGLHENGDPIPLPSSRVEYVEVHAA
jgi:predicted RNase H-like HicB family nuclease